MLTSNELRTNATTLVKTITIKSENDFTYAGATDKACKCLGEKVIELIQMQFDQIDVEWNASR
eukprot:UN02456